MKTIVKSKKEITKSAPMFMTNDKLYVFSNKHPKLYWIHKETLEKGSDEPNTLDYSFDPDYYYFKTYRTRNYFYKKLKLKQLSNV